MATWILVVALAGGRGLGHQEQAGERQGHHAVGVGRIGPAVAGLDLGGEAAPLGA